MKIPFFSGLSQEKLHHVFLVLGLVFLSASVLGYAAFRAGYTFEVSQFFASSCDPEQLSGSIDGGTVSITNNNGAPCDVHVTIWRVYKPAYDPEFISTQELHDSAFEGGLAPGATTQLSVGTPSCTYQFDIATGTVRTTLPYGNDLIDSGIISPTGLYCGESPPEETPIPTPVPTPTPTVVPPACAPTTQNVDANASAVITASGGTSEYSWSAPGGAPASATGSSLSVAYASPGTYTVTLTSGGNQATCSVVVAAVATPTPSPSPTPSVTPSPTPSVTPIPTPTPSITPTPTPISTAPALSITKVVRLVNQNGLEVDSVAAQPGEPVEFVIRVSSNGAGTAFGVIARDLLPAGLVYQVGSTRIDSLAAGDGILTGGLPLGDMAPGRVITIRFRATLAPAGTFAPGTTMLTNVALARASNVAEVSDPAFVSVTQIPSGPLTLELTKLGRNQSRQEVAFHSPVAGAASEVIVFSIRVRNPGTAPATNIVVRDVVPQVITPIPQTVTLNGAPVPDQALATGVVVGTLAPGQEAFIVFSGRIAPAAQLPQGLMTVINTATLTATNIPTLTVQLPINITNYIGPVAQVPTGPGDSALLALIVSVTLTLVYVGYLGTDVHRRKEAVRVAKESRDQIDFRQ